MLPTALQRYFEDIYPSATVRVKEVKEGLHHLHIKIGIVKKVMQVNLRTVSQSTLLAIEEEVTDNFMEKGIEPYD